MQTLVLLAVAVALFIGMRKYRAYADDKALEIERTKVMEKSALRGMNSWDKNPIADTRTVRRMKATLDAPSYFDRH